MKALFVPVSFATFGCKLNQLETEALSDAFQREGFPVTRGGPDMPLLCIINTCTVTSKAEQKARRVIRQYLQAGSLVLVTGCYAQLEREALEKLGKKTSAVKGKNSSGALFVFPGQGKEKLLDFPHYLAVELNAINKKSRDLKSQLSKIILNFLMQSREERKEGRKNLKISNPSLRTQRSLREEKTENFPVAVSESSRNPFSFNPEHFSFHSRAFLKIQDGCDFSCAYCRVPLARGKSISIESQEALDRLKALEAAGMAEAVLTGVNICQYSDPGDPLRRLPGLLRFLLDNTTAIAIRLSSIEPDTHGIRQSDMFPCTQDTILCNTNCNTTYGEDFFAVLSHRRIRNHFHLSVQSGSDSVLAAMGRKYRADDIVWMVEKLRAIRDDPFIACDMITGFPGETDEDFEKTAALCRKLDFAWIHAFPYSKRPGTGAAEIKKGLVSEKTAGERLKTLVGMAKIGKKGYIQRWQGKVVDAAAEAAPFPDSSVDDFSPFFPALTDNYIKVCVPSGKKVMPGRAFKCRIGKPDLSQGARFDAWAELL